MGTVQEAEELLAQMTRAEEAQLLQAVVRDLGDAFPGIGNTQRVGGGGPRIARTRIPICVLEHAHRLDTSGAELLTAYPSPCDEDLANAGAYVRAHRDEIERQIVEHESAQASARLFADSGFSRSGVSGRGGRRTARSR